MKVLYDYAVLRPDLHFKIVIPPPTPWWKRLWWALPGALGIGLVIGIVVAFFSVHPEALIYAVPSFGFSFAFALVVGMRK